MSSFVYSYSITSDFSGVYPNYSNLHHEINTSIDISTPFNGLKNIGDTVDVVFAQELSNAEQTSLNNLIINHDPDAIIQTTQPLVSDIEEYVPLQTLREMFSPIVSSSSIVIPTDTSKNFIINGYHFTPNTTVSFNSSNISVTSVIFINPNQLNIFASANQVESLYDMVVTNEVGFITLSNFLNVYEISWIDLRLGGDTLIEGDDIRVRSGITIGRDADGMFFDGLNPWSSWVKFELSELSWQRNAERTLDIIFTRPTNSMMLGIGSDQTNETSSSQFSQGEVLAYFSNSTTFFGFYGNNGTPGSTGSQSVSQNITSTTGVYKLSFEEDGNVVKFYQLDNADESSWEGGTLISETTISFSPQQTNLFPMIIPRSGSAQRFIALRLM